MEGNNQDGQARMTLFHKGESIFHEGDVNTQMYKIVDGQAEVYLNYGTESEYLLGIVSKGRCIGDVSLLSGKPEVYTVIAYSDVLALSITHDHLQDFVSENHKDIMDIMENMANMICLMKTNMDMLWQDTRRLLEELKSAEEPEKPTAKKISDLELKLRRYMMPGADGGLVFSKRL